MQCNGNFKQWFNIFLIISEAWQGYESKAYGVSNQNLKLQSKKLSRTRDIPNFPTQGWVDTAFYTRNWSQTYIALLEIIVKYGVLSSEWGGMYYALFEVSMDKHCEKMSV